MSSSSPPPPPTTNIERTYVMIKPDAVQRNLIGEIITRFEKQGLQLVALKMTMPTDKMVDQHYEEHAGKPFFGTLTSFIKSGPVVAMVWKGRNAVKKVRRTMGETNPQNSLPGTIRGDYALTMDRNIIHGSDSVESAEREIAIWFSPDEILAWNPTLTQWIY